jgi:OOP family OmpA-OmpF porin
MKKIQIAIAALFLALSGSAFAQQYGKQGQVELSPFFGIIFPDDYVTLNPNEGPIAGLRFGVWFSNSIGAEVSAQRAFSELGTGSSNIDMDGYRLNLLWNMLSGRVRPFLTLGAGYERFDSTPTGSEYSLGYNGGLGFRFFASQNSGVRLEGRYVVIDETFAPGDDYQNNIEATLGLFFLFGKHEDKAPVPVAVVSKDTDVDGVMDENDQCPGTPAGVKVDDKGCVVSNDDDKDGVPNEVDQCPATPENAPVDQTGCPTDTDADNVKDYMDKCPNTPAGTQVDDMGCPLESKARGVLKGVTFQSGGAVLTTNAHAVLDLVAEELKKFPEVKVEVQGHSDATGNEASNLTLSQKRAQSVVDYLVTQGVPAAQMTAKGYGQSMPIADNKKAAGRELNRRVEIKWLD